MQQWTSKQTYEVLIPQLNEKQRRLYGATEALRLGYGGISKVKKETGISRVTITRGIEELERGIIPTSRIRKVGGGRKKITDSDATLLVDLEKLITDTRGNPMNFVKWTTKSIVHVREGLEKMGHRIKDTAVFKLLKEQHYSLRGNKKDDEGKSHEDRDAQFQHINTQCEEFETAGNPILSIDCKKKEKLGNFKNNGREWKKEGREHDTKVNTYDFWSMVEGVVAPYGIYDVLQKYGFVNVGIDHDTGAFAVESLRKWWHAYGKKHYDKATGILITADSGGSNAARNRLFKRELQKLVNEITIPITLCHYPPATSKWNVIEHQLFSFISINWRAVPLTSLAVVLELISHTTTKSGLTVTAMADVNTYPTKIKIRDKEFKQLTIQRNEFHGEWNYTIAPQVSLTV
jgi:transposase